MTDHEDDSWERRVSEAYRQPVPVGSDEKRRILQRVQSEPRPRRWSWSLERLWEPAPVAVRPLAAMAIGLVLVAAGALLGRGFWPADRDVSPGGPRDATLARSATPSQVVQFVLVAPHASQVSLVGDFNQWDREAHPMRRVKAGDTWTVTVPVPVGRHLYTFIVDGERWVADPVAPLAPEDGFGFRNSVIVVGGTEST